MSSSRPAVTARLALFVVVLVAGTPLRAQSPATVDALRERYPASSIDSIEKADRALGDTTGSKERVDKDYKAAARACLDKVLVNSCFDGARDERRRRMADINAIELEANRFKRADHDRRVEADRARREAERAAKAPDDAAQREHNRAAYDERQKQAAADAERARSRTAKPPKPAARLQSTSPTTDRAKNAAGYEHRRQAAAEHQRDLDRRLVEKDADRKRRAEAKAVKDAKTAAATKSAANPGPAPLKP
jgi:colicin import membrane protein